MLYIMNALVIPSQSDIIAVKEKLSLDEAQNLTKTTAFISAVGHKATADLLSQLLAQPIAENRITVQLMGGDRILAFALEQRLPEGKILSEQELKALTYSFWSIRISNLSFIRAELQKALRFAYLGYEPTMLSEILSHLGI